MRILFIAHRIPYPPNKGDKIRAFHEIVQLSKNHEVHLACLIDRQEDVPWVQELERFCKTVQAMRLSRWGAFLRVVRGLAVGESLSVAYFRSSALHRRIRNLLGQAQFDLVFVYCSSMAQYVVSHNGSPRLIDLVDVDSDKWAQYARHARFPWSWVYSIEAGRLRKYEERLAREFAPILFVSRNEADLFLRTNPRACCVAISNGVDLEYFRPPEREAASGPELIFTGAMDYYPNIDAVTHFCDRILPLIRSERAGVKFAIVGNNPTAQVNRLAKRPGVMVTGGVPDVRPYLASAQVFVAPFRMARGLQNKILEAMAMGLPVVVTTVASTGLRQGEGLRVVDEPQAFAQVTLQLLRDRELRQSLGRESRKLVEEQYRWGDSMMLLEQTVVRAAESS